MGQTIAAIILKSMDIFSEERRRHFSSEFMEKQKAVNDFENARAPEYSDAKKALAIEDLDIFLKAYQTEFNAQIDILKAVPHA